MSEEVRYNVQCLSGDPDHVFGAVPGSAIEIACQRRAAGGSLDALIIQPDECPKCIAEERDRIHEYFLTGMVDWPDESRFGDQLVELGPDLEPLGNALEGVFLNGKPVYVDA